MPKQHNHRVHTPEWEKRKRASRKKATKHRKLQKARANGSR